MKSIIRCSPIIGTWMGLLILLFVAFNWRLGMHTDNLSVAKNNTCSICMVEKSAAKRAFTAGTERRRTVCCCSAGPAQTVHKTYTEERKHFTYPTKVQFYRNFIEWYLFVGNLKKIIRCYSCHLTCEQHPRSPAVGAARGWNFILNSHSISTIAKFYCEVRRAIVG
jgi:hypothetical protein